MDTFALISIQPTISHSHFSCTQGVTECCPLSLGEGYRVHAVELMSHLKSLCQFYRYHFYHCHQSQNQMDQPQHSAQIKIK